MRRGLLGLAVVTAAFLAAGGTAGGKRSATRVRLPAALSVRVPAGWHVLGGWLSYVTDPAPRLALASFPARLSRRTCECGFPNVIRFPRRGAFVFVWEYLHLAKGEARRTPDGPSRFFVAAGRGVRRTCDGPTDEFSFKRAGRVFQVEVYLGPGAEPALRLRVAAVLDSLRVAPET